MPNTQMHKCTNSQGTTNAKANANANDSNNNNNDNDDAASVASASTTSTTKKRRKNGKRKKKGLGSRGGTPASRHKKEIDRLLANDAALLAEKLKDKMFVQSCAAAGVEVDSLRNKNRAHFERLPNRVQKLSAKFVQKRIQSYERQRRSSLGFVLDNIEEVEKYNKR